MELRVNHPRVVAGGHPLRVDCVGLLQEIAELREGVAANARDRRAAACILVHEIVDYVVPEAALEVEHIVRNAQLFAHAPGVIDGLERAAWTIGYVLSVTEQLHRRPDHIVSLLNEHAGGYR